MTDKLPGARAALVDNAGVTTPPFYRYFQALERLLAGTASAADVAAINAQIAAINAEIDALPKSSFPTLQVSAPLTSAGLLGNGFAKLGLTIANSVVVNGVALQLSGDAAAPGNTYLYSTSPIGVKGWNALGGMLAGTTNNIAKTVNADGTVTFNLAPVTDSGVGTFKLITRDSFGRLTGTKAGTTSDVPEGTNLYYTDARVDARLSPGYIDGLQMQWVSGTAVTVSSGTAYVPGLGRYLQSNSAIALSGLTLSASTWYHLYLYSNAGTPAVECVTTAPTLYYGTAYQKTGDNTRRYIGSVRAGPSGNIYDFIHMADGFVRYLEATMNNASEFFVYTGAATVPTTISCANVVPTTGFNVQLHSDNNSQQQMVFSNSMANFTLGAAASLHTSSALPASFTERLILILPLDRSQAFEFMYVSTPSATASIRVFGYWYQR